MLAIAFRKEEVNLSNSSVASRTYEIELTGREPLVDCKRYFCGRWTDRNVVFSLQKKVIKLTSL